MVLAAFFVTVTKRIPHHLLLFWKQWPPEGILTADDLNPALHTIRNVP